MDRDQQGQLILTCPNCRQVTPVPANGVAGLQAAFQINHLLEIVEEHKTMTRRSVSSSEFEKESLSSGFTVEKIPCVEHPDKELELFCETCGEPICLKCIINTGKHHSHNTELLDEAFKKHKKEIAETLEPLEKQLVTLDQALLEVENRSQQITSKRKSIEAEVCENFALLCKTLEARKAELIDQLCRIAEDRLNSLVVQRELIESTRAKVRNSLESAKRSLASDTQSKVKTLMVKKTTALEINELTTSLQPGVLKPHAKADMAFSVPEDLITLCQSHGEIIESVSRLDATKCHITGTDKGSNLAAVGEKSIAIVQTVSFNGEPFVDQISTLECELVADVRTLGNVEKIRGNRYAITYQPTMKGQHQLHVKANGRHIRGSPFPVMAKFPSQLIGTPIRSIPDVGRPWGIAVSPRGEVVVTEWVNNRVSIFDCDGNRIHSFGTQGTSQGQFDTPRGVALDNEGNILVADSQNNRVQKFTAKGKFLAAVGTKGSGPLQFNIVYGIAFNTTNNKVYVADGNHRIQVLNSDLTYSFSFGKEGSGRGQFFRARGLACDQAGNVYVADNGSSCIHVFTPKGKFLRNFFNDLGRNLGNPVDVALDTNGTVYVSEAINHCISVFDAEGQYVTLFGRSIKGPGEIHLPYGVAVDSNRGLVYVSNANCVKVFRRVIVT